MRFVKCAVSPRAAKRMTQGKIALSRRQHQLRPRIARPTRRGSPFSANVKKLTMSIHRFSLSLSLSLSFLPATNPPCVADSLKANAPVHVHVNFLDPSCHSSVPHGIEPDINILEEARSNDVVCRCRGVLPRAFWKRAVKSIYI